MILKRKDLTANVRTMVAAATGRPCYNHKVTDEDPSIPYVILFTIPGGRYYGPVWVAPETDVDVVYQASCVGVRHDQAEWLMDRVRAGFLDRDAAGVFVQALAAPTGWKVIDRSSYGGAGPGGVEESGVLQQGVERFVISLTPA